MLIKHLSDTREITSGDQARLRELLNPRKESLQIDYSLAWAFVEPGKRTLPHTLTYSEVYYILSGKGCMFIDEESKDIRAQDVIYIPPYAQQYIENRGEVPLTFLCIVNPAWHPEAEQITGREVS